MDRTARMLLDEGKKRLDEVTEPFVSARNGLWRRMFLSHVVYGETYESIGDYVNVHPADVELIVQRMIESLRECINAGWDRLLVNEMAEISMEQLNELFKEDD